ncbi:helix-turn-helix domain-containing protein [Bifidobacterium sp. ESL0790]|uniref:helix-turn-helix transcriptional regulator n=1 Tax=Bifidobacterium sp. ESL0790 TaxID=2983233 RepID=UPI0023F93F80|nr:helix-turn-helix domain-containing protein [Bifidobacterium sp. ESL0790]WEV73209.1 helix-turn-helix domain-containing protein [Bifidobacterium sp. ESL0790]
MRTLRRQRQLSQAALAEAVGVSRQTIISIEKGRFDPSLPWPSAWPPCSIAPLKTSSTQNRERDLNLK